MHEPTPPARRVAALQYQAEQLLRDAAAWGYVVLIDGYPGPVIHVLPAPNDNQPSAHPPAPARASQER